MGHMRGKLVEAGLGSPLAGESLLDLAGSVSGLRLLA